MEELLAGLFRAHYKGVYNYLYSLCHSAPLAEDLAAETFLEAVKSIAAFRGEASVKTWLFTIARRRWFAHLRRQKKQVETVALAEFLEREQAMPHQTVEDLAAEKALAARVGELLSGEPPRTAGIVQMRMAGYSFYEIGQKFGISENSARVIDFRAKAKMKEILRKEGFYDV